MTVPTPIGDGHRPLLTPLRGASETLGKVLKKGDIVGYHCRNDEIDLLEKQIAALGEQSNGVA